MSTAALDLLYPPGSPELPGLVSAVLDDFGLVAIHELEPDEPPRWRVFFARAAARDAAAGALDRAFSGRGLVVLPAEVPDEDWAARSQAQLRAVRIGRVVVAPPWDRPADTGTDDLVIVIQPSMGFGTGHHETTRLCLGLLQESGCDDRQVLDVGAGSAVLAIAAARLGAREVLAVDADADAVASARESLKLNAEAPAGGAGAGRRVADVVRVREGDLRSLTATADVVLANLTGGLLIATARHLLARARAGGTLILSGFQPREADDVLGAFSPGAQVIARRADGDWEAAALRRHSGAAP